MRDHVRRQAGQDQDSTWWVVALAFSLVAVATVAFTAPPTEDDVHAVAVQPVADAPATMPVSAPPQPQPAEPTYEATEHIQAF